MKQPETFLPLHPNDFQILFSLLDEPRHGYGIVREVESGSGGRIRIDPANLYRSIKRLMRAELVAESISPEVAGPEEDRRRFYELTPLGMSVVRLEASRLDDLASAARARRLIPGGRAR